MDMGMYRENRVKKIDFFIQIENRLFLDQDNFFLTTK